MQNDQQPTLVKYDEQFGTREHQAVLYNDKFYIVGGKGNGICFYDLHKKKWQKIPNSAASPDNEDASWLLHRGVLIADKWYLFAGKFESTYSSTLYIYEFASNTWEKVPSAVVTPRVDVCFIARTHNFNTSLVTCLGYDGNYISTMHEIALNNLQGDWKLRQQYPADIVVGRTAPAYAYDKLHDELYVHGGYSSTSDRMLDCYNFATSQWRSVDWCNNLVNAPCKRYSHSMAFVGIYNPLLILIRGSGRSNDTNDIHLMDINQQKHMGYSAEKMNSISNDYAMAVEESTGYVYVHQQEYLYLIRVSVDAPCLGMQVKLQQWTQHAKKHWSDMVIQFAN